MASKKRPKLPRGLRWHPGSQFIWFTWYDAQGKQHKKSTETGDPEKALLFKMRFVEERETRTADGAESPDLTNEPLERAAKLYFEWKLANNSPETVSRESRMFKNVLKFFGPKRPVKSIRLWQIREYQKQRRNQISPTMKMPVTARTVNYEMQLLKGVMTYADCWADILEARYRPLRQHKSCIGMAASKEQLIKMITAAMNNEYWQVAMWCLAVAAKRPEGAPPPNDGTRGMGLRQLLAQAQALGASKSEHYLLPLNVAKSRGRAKGTDVKWDVNRPMTSWVKSWRKLMEACGMKGFRFHDLRHTFRSQGAEAGVPLEVMMAQLGHMDRETSLDYVHIQQRALERARKLIEAEQAEILASTQVQNERSVRVKPPGTP